MAEFEHCQAGEIRNRYYSLYMDEYGVKTFSRVKSGQVLFTLTPLYEFALQVDSGECKGMVTSEQCGKQFIQMNHCIRTVYRHELFDMDVRYTIDDEAVYKTLRLTAGKRMTLLYAQTEVSRTEAVLRRGGEGQPIFVADSAYISIIFPAAQNYFDGNTVRLEQAPYITLGPGESFDFCKIIYGFNTEGTLERSFSQYIINHKKKTPAGLRIYGDWGAHDELAGEAGLNEELALRLLEELEGGNKQERCFDYYLMDAFWFEADDSYQSFKSEAWPNGPGRFKTRLKELGMRFGLWFDVNMEKLILPRDCVRQGDSGRSCLSYGKNCRLLFDGIREQIRQCGCAMLKLDFAYFDCTCAGHAAHSPERIRSKEPAIRNFLEELLSLYKLNPELLVLGYNGFTTDLECIASVDPNYKGYPISPWWCLYLDYLYCGDPRPSELPSESIGSSMICYTDCMIERFSDSLMPYPAIDDHGTMIGNTNTIYYIGKDNFKDSWIMNISRGGRKLHLYGALELLEKEDWEFIRESGEFFDFTCREDVRTAHVAGSAQKGEVYGYSNSGRDSGYLTLVNPGDVESSVSLAMEEWEGGEEILFRPCYRNTQFQNSGYEAIRGRAAIRLKPYEVALYHWKRGKRKNPGKEGYAVLEGRASLLLTLSGSCAGFSLSITDEQASPIRLFGGEEDPVRAECLNEGAVLTKAFTNPIWSGCSWAAYTVAVCPDANEAKRIMLHNRGERCLFIRWHEE